ncbi:hypothetical protein Dip510_001762 [Elusimicrobium posterum]|uniref:hypothetical protein n=1 Tax=Elusimicrobium posterum TaxID=3116653 RepID=UPI003C71526E
MIRRTISWVVFCFLICFVIFGCFAMLKELRKQEQLALEIYEQALKEEQEKPRERIRVLGTGPAPSARPQSGMNVATGQSTVRTTGTTNPRQTTTAKPATGTAAKKTTGTTTSSQRPKTATTTKK